MKKVILASVLLFMYIPASTNAAEFSVRPGCPRLFTIKATRHTAQHIYAGTRHVTERNLRRLGLMEACQRNPAAQGYVRWYDRSLDKRHHKRVKLAAQRRYIQAHRPWYGPVTASWYYDAGSTACGFHATYGFASLTLPCGAHIEMRGPGGAVVTAIMQDRGPYVGGRMFDLNPALKAALGCGDLCEVEYR